MWKYWLFFKAAYQITISYRVAVVIRVIRDLAIPAFFILLWSALYKDRQDIGGFTLQAMATYYIMVKILDQIYTYEPSSAVNRDIKMGDLSNHLVKPISYIIFRAFYALGRRLARISLTIIAVILLFLFFPNLVAYPSSLNNWIWFGVILIVSWTLFFEVAFIMGELAFWLSQTWNFRGASEQVMTILGGFWIPLNLFPENIQAVLNLLPFRFLYYYPVQVFQGKVDLSQIYREFTIEIFWVVLFGMFIKFLWDKGIEKYEGVGK